MTERMVVFQVRIPARLRESLRTRAKALNLRPADVARWALAREIGEPTLSTKGGVATAVKMLARGAGDTDETLAELRSALKSICKGGQR